MQPAQTEANNLRQILKDGHLNQNVLKLQDYGISYNSMLIQLSWTFIHLCPLPIP